MDFDFKDKELIALYTKGRSRKYKFINAKMLDNFLDCIQGIEAVDSIQEWWSLPGLNFEKLAGYKNRFSMRIDGKYRLEFSIDFEDEKKTRGFVTVLTISKHYQ